MADGCLISLKWCFFISQGISMCRTFADVDDVEMAPVLARYETVDQKGSSTIILVDPEGYSYSKSF
jgi:hypothetical protein